MKKPERPILEASYIGIRKIFDCLEEARKTVAAADKCKDPSDAIYYRSGLDTLVRLEAQADALTYAFQMERSEILKWLDDMRDYIKALEALQKRKSA